MSIQRALGVFVITAAGCRTFIRRIYLRLLFIWSVIVSRAFFARVRDRINKFFFFENLNFLNFLGIQLDIVVTLNLINRLAICLKLVIYQFMWEKRCNAVPRSADK